MIYKIAIVAIVGKERLLMSSVVDIFNSQNNRPHQLIKYLSKYYDIDVICVNDQWKSKQKTDHKYFEQSFPYLKDINVQYITNKKVSVPMQEYFYSRVNRIKNLTKYKIHINYNTVSSGNRYSNLIPTIYDMADDLPSMIGSSPQIPKYLHNIAYEIGRISVSRSIKKAEMCVFTSENLLKKYSIDKSKSVIIPNGVDTNLFAPALKNNSQGSEDIIIGYVGVIREWVDLLTPIRLMKYLDYNYKLMIVGAEGDYDKIKKIVREEGLENRIIFTGCVPYFKIPEIIAEMDICIIPFFINEVTNDALPLKLFEYMACEKPVISTPLTTIKQVVGDKIYYASNIKEYREEIIKIIENYDILRYKTNRNFVVENYDWNVLFEKYKFVIDQME